MMQPVSTFPEVQSNTTAVDEAYEARWLYKAPWSAAKSSGSRMRGLKCMQTNYVIDHTENVDLEYGQRLPSSGLHVPAHL